MPATLRDALGDDLDGYLKLWGEPITYLPAGETGVEFSAVVDRQRKVIQDEPQHEISVEVALIGFKASELSLTPRIGDGIRLEEDAENEIRSFEEIVQRDGLWIEARFGKKSILRSGQRQPSTL